MHLPIDFSNLEGADQIQGAARGCLELVQTERNPIAAFCLHLLLTGCSDKVTSDDFQSWGIVGQPEDFLEVAFEGFMKEAKSGSIEAARYIALFYQAGWHPVKRSAPEYRYWLGFAASQGDKGAIAELAGPCPTVVPPDSIK